MSPIVVGGGWSAVSSGGSSTECPTTIFYQVETPEFGDTITPTDTSANILVMASVSYHCYSEPTNTVTITADIDTGGGMFTILTEHFDYTTGDIQDTRSITFTVPSGSTYKITDAGNCDDTIRTVFEAVLSCGGDGGACPCPSVDCVTRIDSVKNFVIFNWSNGVNDTVCIDNLGDDPEHDNYSGVDSVYMPNWKPPARPTIIYQYYNGTYDTVVIGEGSSLGIWQQSADGDTIYWASPDTPSTFSIISSAGGSYILTANNDTGDMAIQASSLTLDADTFTVTRPNGSLTMIGNVLTYTDVTGGVTTQLLVDGDTKENYLAMLSAGGNLTRLYQDSISTSIEYNEDSTGNGYACKVGVSEAVLFCSTAANLDYGAFASNTFTELYVLNRSLGFDQTNVRLYGDRSINHMWLASDDATLGKDSMTLETGVLVHHLNNITHTSFETGLIIGEVATGGDVMLTWDSTSGEVLRQAIPTGGQWTVINDSTIAYITLGDTLFIESNYNGYGISFYYTTDVDAELTPRFTMSGDGSNDIFYFGNDSSETTGIVSLTNLNIFASGNGAADGNIKISSANDILLTPFKNVVAGKTGTLLSTATDGFLYIPTIGGTPIGTPTAYTGKVPLVCDTLNNKLYFYSGGAWRDAGP